MKNIKPFIASISTVTVFILLALASSPPPAPTSQVYNGVFNYAAEKNDVVKNANKLKFLTDNPNPTIVLRVPHATQQVLEEDKNVKSDKISTNTNTLYDVNVYNIIEKELLKGGFTVRDRALFGKVLEDKSVNDYSKITELTQTDFILELSNFQYVPYAFNSFEYTTSGKKGTVNTYTHNCSHSIFLYGLKLEFKLIKVKENDFIGSFTYNYSPCSNNACNYLVSCLGENCSEPYILQGNVKITSEKLITQDIIAHFVKASSESLVKEIMK